MPVDAPHLRLRALYDQAEDDRERRRVVTGALEELRNVRFSRRAAVDLDTREGRLMVGRDPRPVSVVAYAFGYSHRHVHRLRAEAREHDRKQAA